MHDYYGNKKPINKPPIRKQLVDDVETETDDYMREDDFLRDDDISRDDDYDRAEDFTR